MINKKTLNIFINKIEYIKFDIPILINNCTNKNYLIDYSYLMYTISEVSTVFELLNSVVDDTKDENSLEHFLSLCSYNIINICNFIRDGCVNGTLSHKKLKSKLEEIGKSIDKTILNLKELKNKNEE